MRCVARFAPERWAEEHFGSADLGDKRRTKRAVKVAAGMARKPAASIPAQAGNPYQAKADYRMFDSPDVTYDGLIAPHLALSRERAAAASTVLMIQDTTHLDFTKQPSAKELGPIGDGRGRGFVMHSTLAVDPTEGGEVLGMASQQLFCREEKGTSSGETRAQRARRKRESQRWPESVETVGAAGDDQTRWVHVCDREADDFAMFSTCCNTGVDFLIRAGQNRNCASGHGAAEPSEHLQDWTRTLSAGGEKSLSLRSRPNRRARETTLKVAWAPVTLFEPQSAPQGSAPLHGWVVRAWEPKTPKGEDRIEWILMTTVPVESVEDAKLMLYWYMLRWLIEEYHKCLKTGCRVEKRQLETRGRLEACIAMLNVVAVRLLSLKLLARTKPDADVKPVVGDLHVQVLAAHQDIPAESVNAYRFWREVAKMGGFMGRKGDGDPGWQTLWLGWMQLEAMVIGARLLQKQPTRCG